MTQIKYHPGKGYYLTRGGQRVSGHYLRRADAEAAIEHARKLRTSTAQNSNPSNLKSDSASDS